VNDLNDLILSKVEKKCLYALKRYPHADIGIQELNGYLHFPPLEAILKAIGTLEKNGLIDDKPSPLHGFQLTGPGEEYIKKHRLAYRLAPHIKAIVIATIGGLIATALAKAFGLN